MISIIIPTYNEADQIMRTICSVRKAAEDHPIELIIVDGGSNDATVAIAQKQSARVIQSNRKGRGAQMNTGASAASGELLYFLHADSIPPKAFTTNILYANRKGFSSGCFRLQFDVQHWFLKANCWFTRFDANAVRFGDQSLFVTKEVFEKSGGFREDLIMMEDQEIIHRIKRHGKFLVMKDYVTTSARKYIDNGIYRMQGIFFRIWFMYYLGYSQEQMLKKYKQLIRNHKL